ncbi:MAG: fatty acid CoA ligase family protein [Pirellulales bacterium]
MPSTAPAATQCVNVATRLAEFAARMPENLAVAAARRGSSHYDTITFGELDADATRIARGLMDWGVKPGTRLALLVRPGIDFVTLVFALLRAGVVIVLVDPGLGRKNLVRCLAEAEPEGFVGIPAAQAARLWYRHSFLRAKWNVTVGHRWFWGGPTLDELRHRGDSLPATCPLLPATRSVDPAAIIFTSGSTGPPKGVLYTHQMFDTQVAEIQSMYSIEPGRVDLSCFPLFALFNSAMGVTTVLPEMDFSRPAAARPSKLLRAANDWKVSQAFASPAVWPNLSEHCRCTETHISTLRHIFSCGAPVPAEVLKKAFKYVAPNAKMHTPYGATECLPVATIEAAEVLGETAARAAEGGGVCVGRKFDSIEWRVIRITDEPIATIDEAEELPTGEIGELIVRGPQASPRYVTRTECNAPAKICDDSKRAGASSPPSVWHRMGDVGYLDDQGRFWYCGRKSHRVTSANGPMFSECVERVFDSYHWIRRCALVGIGPKNAQTPILVYEENLPREIYNPSPDGPHMPWEIAAEIPSDLAKIAAGHDVTASIRHFLPHKRFPVDVRHNAKINRELLAEWAATKLPELA